MTRVEFFDSLKSRRLFCEPFGPTEVVPLLQSMTRVEFFDSLKSPTLILRAFRLG